MCGFLGYFGNDKNILENLTEINSCSKSLEKRGPDASGTAVLNNIIIHHKRLSIIGLNEFSNQPFGNNDSLLAFNGEIYNYKLLKKSLENKVDFKSNSDTEVLYWGLKIFGKKFINNLEGMFSFAYYDSSKNNLILCRDRFGEKPLYFVNTQKGIFFSSDIKSLLLYSKIKPEVDKENFIHYLAHGYYPQKITPFKNIKKVKSGTYLEISNNKVSKKKYWSINNFKNNLDIEYTTKKITEELKDYVTKSFNSDVPISLSLSAGLDSTLLASIAQENKIDINCFCIGYEDKKGLDERQEAEKFAKDKNLKFKSIEIEENLDFDSFLEFVECQVTPIADISGYAQYKISKEVSKNNLKVLISGVGGDEIFFGYPYLYDTVILNSKLSFAKKLRGILNKNFLIFKAINFLRNLRRKSNKIYFLKKTISYLYFILFFLSDKTPAKYPISIALSGAPIFFNPQKNISEIRELINFKENLDFYKFYKKLFKYDKKNLLFWTTESVIETWLEGNLLSMSDSVGMGNSVEIRAPFLSKNINNLVNNYYLKKSSFELDNKNLLRKISKNILPSSIIERPKTGFVPPVNSWINKLWDHKIKSINSFETLKSLNLLNRNKLKNNKFSGTLKYRLIVADIWFRKILQN